MASIEIRHNKKARRRYRARVRIKGKPFLSATFDRKTQAREWALQKEAAIRRDLLEKRNKHTVSDMINRYLNEVLPDKPKARKAGEIHLSWWKGQIGPYSLDRISPSLLAECRNHLRRGMTSRGGQRSPATVNRYLSTLSHVFTVAVREWQWLEDSPTRRLAKLKEPPGRTRFLREDERHRLLNSCRLSGNKNLYLAVVLSLSTGARQMEILSLRWKDINLKHGLIVLNETKNGERRSLPLQGYALRLVREKRRAGNTADDALLFPGKRNPDKPAIMRAAWGNALQAAGIKNFRWHDLRHSAASYLAMNGASLAEISEILGHKTLQTTRRYTHFTTSHIVDIVAGMNREIFRGVRANGGGRLGTVRPSMRDS